MTARSALFLRPSGLAPASLVVAALLSLSQPAVAQTECGDVDANGTIVASDSLLVLRKAVGLEESLQCPTMRICSTTTTLHADECFEDSDCVSNPGGPHCCLFECAECDKDTHCPPGFACGTCACVPLE